MSARYEFRSMTETDLPLLHRWLNEPHVSRWWGEPAAQFDLVSGDLDEPAMEQYIVMQDSQPFAYLQCYRLTDWNVCFGEQPEGTRGIDLLIGEPYMLARGHGSQFIRSFA